MSRDHRERGYSSVDVIMGMVLFSLVILTLYQVFLPTLALSRNTGERLARQQDVRLTLDRLARELHETTMARVTIYDCTGGGRNECIGYVTARDATCGGTFRLVDGQPYWQATIYVWRDTASNELRRHCDTSSAFAVSSWPPPNLAPFTVIGTGVAEASGSNPTFAFVRPPGRPSDPAIAVAIALREQAVTVSRARYQTEFLNQTVFVPQNR